MVKNKLDLSSVKFSHQDIKRKIVLPRYMSKELAEEIGIFMGDGSLNIYDYKNRGNYWLQFCGNFTEEISFYNSHLMPLLESLFNHSGSIIISNKDNSFILRIRSKAIANFKINTLNLPFGKKSDKVFIPRFILENKEFLSAFLKGLFDSDGSLTFKKKYKKSHYYPVLKIDSKSKRLIEEVNLSLKGFGIDSYTNYGCRRYDIRTKKTYVQHTVYISGKDNLRKWFSLIGFENPVHLTKYKIWERFGFCPSKTTLSQRLSVLNNEKDISDFMPL